MSAMHVHPAAAGAGVPASLPPSTWGGEEDGACYCPRRLLASFALLMAGHGRCVNIDMMLGDREYAMWQLECARGMDDPELDGLADRLFAFFDDAQHTATPVLGTA
jgi:hypothetical protein